MKHRLSILAAVLALTALLGGTAGKTYGVTLEDLLNGGTIVSGDKEFFNFHNGSQSGDLFVPWDQISVVPIIGGPGTPETELGIRFQSADWTLVGPNQRYDLGLDFHVRHTGGQDVITDNTLEFSGGWVGDGRAQLTEGVLDHATGNTLANKFVFFDQNGTALQDHKVFPGGPYAELEISKDLALTTGSAANSRVFVSHFDQTFSQTMPDGGAGAMAAVTLAGLLACAARKRRA